MVRVVIVSWYNFVSSLVAAELSRLVNRASTPVIL